MHNAGQLLLLCVGQALAWGFVGLALFKGTFRRYKYLCIYTGSMIACDILREACLRAYGWRSQEYFFTYFGLDVLLVVLRYLATISIFEIILSESPFRTQARMAFLTLVGLVVAVSYWFTSNLVISRETLFLKRLIVEVQQNMYFASVVLTLMLCVTLAYLRVKEPQLRALVGGLGMSAAMQAASWAVQSLVPKNQFDALWSVVRYISPVATLAMLAIWCYALTMLPVAVDETETERDRELVLVEARG